MTESYRFILCEDRISPGGEVDYLTAGANRLLFCLDGSAGTGTDTPLTTGNAIMAPGITRLVTGYDGALIWRWELVPEDVFDETEGMGLTTHVLHECELDMNPDQIYAFILEGIVLASESEYPEHELPGPAIACLFAGEITRSANNKQYKVQAGKPWQEDEGYLYGYANAEEEPAALNRGMIIPVDDEGVSLSQPTTDDAADIVHTIHASGIVVL